MNGISDFRRKISCGKKRKLSGSHW